MIISVGAKCKLRNRDIMEVSAFTQPLSEGQGNCLCNHCPRQAEHSADSCPLHWPVSGRLSCHWTMP